MQGLAIHRRLATAAVAIAATALLLPATAPAAAGSLDRSFDGNGRLTIAAAKDRVGGSFAEVTRLASPPMAGAPGPHGELVVADNRRVLRYRANGRPRSHFGGDGRVTIPTPAGMSFQLAGVVVDPSGRVLVAGTTEPAGASGAGSRDARIGVFRFLPDGKIDRSFGSVGVAGASFGPMEATGIALDSLNRPVLTGFSALTPSACGARPVYLNTTAVVRLTTSGAPDRTFGGGDGIFTDPLEDPHLPDLAASGSLVYTSGPEQRCAGFDGYGQGGSPMVSVLSPGGSLASRFPVATVGPFLPKVTSLAVDRHNRIVILVTIAPPEGGGILQRVLRLLPDGNADPEFNGGYWPEPGVVPAPSVAGRHFHAIATDQRSRVVLAGSAPRRVNRRLVRYGFVAARLNGVGKVQDWFGGNGVAEARFGRLSEARATHVHLDNRGRIVVGGTVEAPGLPGGYGFGFARFLSGPR